MPRIVVTTQPASDEQPTVVYQERVLAAQLADDDHYAGQLLERLGWGVADAAEAERRSRQRPAA